MRPPARTAAAALTELLKDEDEQVRAAVGLALKQIDPDAARRLSVP
jgi:HEAT repeat protein